MRIAIIDYGSGNLCSAAKAFERAARESGFQAEVLVTSQPECALCGSYRAAWRWCLCRLSSRA